jgi:hypothetical protein
MPSPSGRRVIATSGSVHSKKQPPQREARDAGYVRARDLPKLVPLWPNEIETLNRTDHARLLARLRRALRAERQRGLSGHWTYDLARHAQLLRAYRAEASSYLGE